MNADCGKTGLVPPCHRLFDGTGAALSLWRWRDGVVGIVANGTLNEVPVRTSLFRLCFKDNCRGCFARVESIPFNIEGAARLRGDCLEGLEARYDELALLLCTNNNSIVVKTG